LDKLTLRNRGVGQKIFSGPLGGVNPYFFLHILFSLVNVRLHTENWLYNFPESALKVPVVVVGGGG
jgi:hypothetical protein